MAMPVTVPEQPRAAELRLGTWLAVLLCLAALVAGWLLKSSVETRSVAFTSADGKISLAYPAGWSEASKLPKDTLLDVSAAAAGEAFPPRFRVQSKPARAGATLRDLSSLASLNRSQELREYRELSSREAGVGGARAIQVTYAYVADPPAGSGHAVLPIVAQGVDTLVLAGDRLIVFTALGQANVSDAENSQAAFDRILGSVRLQQGG